MPSETATLRAVHYGPTSNTTTNCGSWLESGAIGHDRRSRRRAADRRSRPRTLRRRRRKTGPVRVRDLRMAQSHHPGDDIEKGCRPSPAYRLRMVLLPRAARRAVNPKSSVAAPAPIVLVLATEEPTPSLRPALGQTRAQGAAMRDH